MNRVLKRATGATQELPLRAHGLMKETEPVLGNPWSVGGDKIRALGETAMHGAHMHMLVRSSMRAADERRPGKAS